ncbi:MAG: hypothetical protein JXN61_06585 [Sedimentisphaerales bacterium]|nr:hypothetical protein [Sedimentisphaerales bacterium]
MTTSRPAAIMIAAILLALCAPAASHAGHFTLAFQRQLSAWENSAGEGCIGGHVVRVWVWDENGNIMPGIDLKTTWDVLMGATDIDGRAEIPLNQNDFDLKCVDASGSTSDSTRLMTAHRPECWGHYSFEVGFLYKTDASNRGEFDLDLYGTWNSRDVHDDDAPYTKSLAYSGVDPTDYWSDQSYWGNWQSASSYFGQTFIATGNRVVAARVHGIIGGNDLLDWKLQIVTFPGLAPVGPVTSVPFRWPFGWEAFWGVNDNPVVPGQTYMLKAWRDGEGMNIYHVTKNVYANGQYYEGTTAFPQYDLNGHIVCMTYAGQIPPPPGRLDAYFKLDESSGAAAQDSSGNDHHATLYGDPLWQPTAGKLGGALLLDGDGDYLEAVGYKAITGSKSRTVAAWIKTSSGDFKDIVAWGAEASEARWSLVIASSKCGIYVKDGFIFGTTNLADGAWHHVAATLDSDASPDVGEVQLFVDGRAETASSALPRQINTAEGDNLKIAAFNDGDNRYFNGMIDEVAIFNAALTADQVARLCYVGGESFLAGCGRIGIDEDAVLEGDIDRDCSVNGADFALLAKLWLETAPELPADIAQDQTIDYLDVSALTGNWTESIAPLTRDLGLVAHFKLDESAGTTAEESVVGNDGTLHGVATWLPAGGRVDGAIELDGSSAYINTDFNLDPADGPLSAAAWIKAGQPAEVIISQTNGEGTGLDWLAAEASTGKLMTSLRPPGRGKLPLISQFVVTDGDWHHVLLVWNGSYRTLYADGLEVAKDLTAQTDLTSATGGLYFGVSNSLASTTFFDGLIDDIRIYNRAIAPEDAAALSD